MNNLELEKLVKKDGKLSKIFLGVFASDQLPSIISKYPSALIVNTQPSHMKGEHWVAMYFDEIGNVDYFDSFGMLPFVPELISFMSQNSKLQNFNQRRLQSYDSSVCGLYALYFLYFRCRNHLMLNIVNVFEFRNHSFNDKIVCNFLAKVFHHVHKVCCILKK